MTVGVDSTLTDIGSFQRVRWLISAGSGSPSSPLVGQARVPPYPNTGPKGRRFPVTVRFLYGSVADPEFLRSALSERAICVVNAANAVQVFEAKKALASTEESSGQNSTFSSSFISKLFKEGRSRIGSDENRQPKVVVIDQDVKKVEVRDGSLLSPQQPLVVWDCVWEAIFSCVIPDSFVRRLGWLAR